MSRLRPSLRRALLITGALSALALGACREDDLARAVAALPASSAIPGYGLPVEVGYLNTPNDAYAWGERSYGLDRVFYDTPPDYGFDYEGVQPWVWETEDDWAMYADPYEDNYRYYYYEPGDVGPYYIRDDEYGYGYDDGGRLVAIYDVLGHLMPASFLYDRRDVAGDYYWRAYDMRRHRARARPIIIQQNIWLERQPYFVDDYNPWLRAAQYEPWVEYRERNDWAIVRAFDGEADRRKFHPGFPSHAKGWGPPFLRVGDRRVAYNDDGRWYDDGRWQPRERNWFGGYDDRRERFSGDDGRRHDGDSDRSSGFDWRGRDERVRDASLQDGRNGARRDRRENRFADDRRLNDGQQLNERQLRIAERRAFADQVEASRRGDIAQRGRQGREDRAAERRARLEQGRAERFEQADRGGRGEREARMAERQVRVEQGRGERRALVEQGGRPDREARQANRQARMQQVQNDRRAEVEQRGRGQQESRQAERQARMQQAQERRRADVEQRGRGQQEAREAERQARMQQFQEQRRADMEQRGRGQQEARQAERQGRMEQAHNERRAQAEQRGRAEQEARQAERQARMEQAQNERRAQAEQRGRAEQEARRAEQQARGQQAQEQRRAEMEQRGRAQQEARQAEQEARAQHAQSEREGRSQQARAEREARNQQGQAERQARQQQPQQEASDGGGRPDRGEEHRGRGRKG